MMVRVSAAFCVFFLAACSSEVLTNPVPATSPTPDPPAEPTTPPSTDPPPVVKPPVATAPKLSIDSAFTDIVDAANDIYGVAAAPDGKILVSLRKAGGAIGWGVGALSFLFIVGVAALELLVCAIQAYVFALLTTLYLNDAINLH